MLVLSRRADDSIVFPGLGVTIHILRLSRQVARVGIEAPPEIRILRRELDDGTTEETFDVNEFQIASTITRDELHALRNQLNVINLGLQYYRHQMDAGLVDDANKTFLQVIDHLNQLEREVAEQAESLEDRSQDQNLEKPIRVLLVEDDKQQQDLLAGILAMRGFDVETANNGHEAIKHLDEYPAPDFVLMDMRMADGDGPATVRSLNSRFSQSNLRILATSGSNPSELGLHDGFDRWFAKPLNTDGLVQYMTESCGATLPTSN